VSATGATATTPFATRLAARVARFGPLCVGIDPSPALLRQCGIDDSAAGLYQFGARILHAARFALSIVKPQMAYFERHGSAGIAALERLIAACRSEGVMVLLDGKRGDIDATAEAYAQAYSGAHSALACDAYTVHAYLGLAALAPAIDYTVAAGGGVCVVVRSSNAEGTALQHARTSDGRGVSELLADQIAALNARYQGTAGGPIGAVLGATADDAGALAARMPGAWLLAPGVGAQGASIADIARRFGAAAARVLPNVSRGVLARGADPAQIATALAELQGQAAMLRAP
jgi:orotidine-5'-phosphate decarboxylase